MAVQEQEYIYVAGPLTTSGLMWHNVRNALKAADEILAKGHIPFVPHLSAIWAMSTKAAAERPESGWIEWGLRWVDRCNSTLRLEGASNGSDGEVKRTQDSEKKVYWSTDEILPVGAEVPE
jgi:hypothetical protein